MVKRRFETLSSGTPDGPPDRDPSKTRARQVSPIDTVVGRRIRLRRTMLGLSSEEVAEKVGVAHQQLLKYEIAQNRVSAARLYRLASVLNVPVHWFFAELADDAAVPSDAVAISVQGGRRTRGKRRRDGGAGAPVCRHCRRRHSPALPAKPAPSS